MHIEDNFRIYSLKNIDSLDSDISSQQVGIEQISSCGLTIGNFDGVHLGHQAVIKNLKDICEKMNLSTAVMLFEPQPLEFFGSNPPLRLTSLAEKLHYLALLGIDFVVCVKFNQDFAKLSAHDFVEKMLLQKLKINLLQVGDDFRFGKGRVGDFNLLQELGIKHNFTVLNSHSFNLKDQRISSSLIRDCLLNHDFLQINQLLGRDYSLFGKVIDGKKLGRTLGFPTANLLLRKNFPLKGVFAVTVKINNQKPLHAIANLGNRPSVDGFNNLCEVHIFDFSADLYGQLIEVCFHKFIRDEIKFSSLDELKTQIHQDLITAKDFLQQNFIANISVN